MATAPRLLHKTSAPTDYYKREVTIPHFFKATLRTLHCKETELQLL